MTYLKNGSVNDKHVFLVAAYGSKALELLEEFTSITIVPRGNIKTTTDVYLQQHRDSLVTLYLFLNEEEAFIFRIKY